jgi:hypothetical protein
MTRGDAPVGSADIGAKRIDGKRHITLTFWNPTTNGPRPDPGKIKRYIVELSKWQHESFPVAIRPKEGVAAVDWEDSP